jgi:hypothetical protein
MPECKNRNPEAVFWMTRAHLFEESSEAFQKAPWANKFKKIALYAGLISLD